MPVVAIVDSNCDPDGITYPIPGNDDAGRAITLYCDLIARAAIDGIERAQGSLGADLGADEEPISEPGLEGEEASEEGAAAPAKKKPIKAAAKPEAEKPPKKAEAETEETPEPAAQAD
jgi:small subunit ribosomal protein S2